MRFDRILSNVLLGFVKFYQKWLSPIKPKSICCRFHPTCSNYAIGAIKKYGAVNGTRRTINRLKRCRPDNTESCIDFP